MKILILLHTITLFVMPLYVVRFSLFTIPFTLLEVFILLSVLATFIYCIKQRISFKSFRTFFDLPILFFMTAALLSLFITPDVKGGLGIFKAYFIEPIIFYYSVVFVGRRNKDYKFILVGLIGSALLVVVLGLVQKLTGQFIFAEHEWVQGRISSFYNSANAAALFIGPIIAIITVFFFQAKKNIYKITFLGLLILFSVVMFWTKSKGGMLAEIFSLGVIIYGVLSYRFKLLKKVWYVLPTLFLVLSVVFFIQVFQLYHSTIDSYNGRIEDDTLQIRYATWFSTTQILVNETVLGTGLNGFKYVYDDYKLTNFQEDFQYPHMIIFNFWTETGLLGLISFIVLISYCFYVCAHLNKNKSHLIGLGMIGAFSYIVIHGLVDVPYFKNDLALQFWALVGITQLLKDYKIKEHI